LTSDGLAPRQSQWFVIGLVVALVAVVGFGTWFVIHEGSRDRGASVTGGSITDPLVRGERVYGLCANCHGVEGGGQIGRAPALLGSPLLGVENLVRLIRHGYRSDRSSKWIERMAGAPALGDHDVAAVVTWVRARFAGSEEVVTAEEVAVIRAATGRRMQPWTTAELVARQAASEEKKTGPR